ncbi:lytic transglycosylase domain-containing protein [Leptospira sarikeiensis]|uniref:Lytic transglycosylase domain-containing protein n=1 Tax=Leptospira sarikeiensis TaxID=2484943 RepID=A0A4R9KH50_9LEPT|nr:lytic transglycosylase domain-containing protein [Leptospira sarikeiensis]TGL64878.1 lytic transglycosylase domain-containing protein [Leptospira sarikeiensis]
MLQPKIRKRYIFIASLPLLYQSFVAPIAGSLIGKTIPGRNSLPEVVQIKEYIRSERPSLSEEELELLSRAVDRESGRIHDSACGVFCQEGEKAGLLLGIIKTESEFYRKARSKKNALGLMQIMPGTGSWIASWEGNKIKKEDLFLPETNIHLGVSYLNHLLETHEGNLRQALLAYNAGPAAVKKWGGVPAYAEEVFSGQEEYLGSRE